MRWFVFDSVHHTSPYITKLDIKLKMYWIVFVICSKGHKYQRVLAHKLSCKRMPIGWTTYCGYLWSKKTIVHYNILMLYQINYQNIYGCFKFCLIKTTTESSMQWRKLVSLPSLLTVDSGWHYEYKLPSISQWGQTIFEFAFAFDLQKTYIFVNYLLHFL